MEPKRATGSAPRLLIGPTLVVCPQLVEVEPKLVKYTLTEQQAAMLRQIAAASSAVPIVPKSSNTAWALEQRGLIKRSWRGSGHVAVVTSDGRYFLKHGKHPKEVQAEKERLAGDTEQAERAPADGAELIARLHSAATGKLTVLIRARRPGGGGGRPSTTRSITITYRESSSCAGQDGSVVTASSR